MAWTSIGTGSTGANTGNNQASIVHTVGTNNVGVGEVGIISISQDNPGAADTFTTSGAANPVVSTVADSAGNNWFCAGEFQNAQGAAQAGVSCSLWWTRATADLPVGGTITATFVAGSSASFDESATSLWVFGVDSDVSVIASTGVAADASTVLGVLDKTVAAGSNLRFRAVASESTATTALTTSAGWGSISPSRSSNVGGTGIRGEFLITSATTAASGATLNVSADHASVYMVLQENQAGDGSANVDIVSSGVGEGIQELSGDGAANVDVVASGGGSSLSDQPGTANVDFVAAGAGDGIADIVGSANVDIAVGGVAGADEVVDGGAYGELAYGEPGDNEVSEFQDRNVFAEVSIVAEGAGAAIEPSSGVAEFGFVANGAMSILRQKVRVIATAPYSGRGKTGLSHSGDI